MACRSAFLLCYACTMSLGSNVGCCHMLYISPPGGALPGRSEPTVDTLSVPPISPNWYYFMAGGGAILFLVIAVVMAIGCRRLTAKRSRPTMAYYSPHSAYYPNGAMSRAGGGPKLTVWVEKGDGNSYWWGDCVIDVDLHCSQKVRGKQLGRALKSWFSIRDVSNKNNFFGTTPLPTAWELHNRKVDRNQHLL